MNIVLVGYMGSGKSSIGRRLANRLSYDFIDLDEHLESYAKASIDDIFAQQGEESFRELESYLLKKILISENIVVATGGGTPCHDDNMEFINENCISVYLQLPVDKIYKRLLKAKKSRPLIENLEGRELELYVRDHFAKREPCYLKAHIIVDADKINAHALDSIALTAKQIQESNGTEALA